MNVEAHWENVFREKAADAVSWYRPHLETSLDLIERRAPARSSSIIDVGAGESTLVDDLLSRGYREIAILDVSGTAIEATRKRLGPAGDVVRWVVGDVTESELPLGEFDVWH